MIDIRIDTTFLRNKKTRRLKQKLGADGILALIGLWIYAAENRPKGVLTGMDMDDIAVDSGWTGSSQEFIDALMDEKSKFLEWNENEKCFQLHNWEKRNPYVFFGNERSEKARKAAKARWGKNKENAGSIENECTEHTGSIENHACSNAKTQKTDAPSPAPSPSPSPNTPLYPPKGDDAAGFDDDPVEESITPATENQSPPEKPPRKKSLSKAEQIYDLYPRKVKKDAAIRAIEKALKKEPFETLLEAVREYAGSEYVRTAPMDKIPHPATWFNGGRWADDRSEWNRHYVDFNQRSGGNGEVNLDSFLPPPRDPTPEDIAIAYGE